MNELDPRDLALSKLELSLLEYTVNEDHIAAEGVWQAIDLLTKERYPEKKI